ncbi:MAG: copper homeostasis membrane protein CopD [Gammaproteobacteria bacterium]
MSDAILVGSRLLQFAGALVLLGASLFYLYGLKAGSLPLPALQRRQWPQRTLTIAALAAAVGTVLWVMGETVLFSGELKDAFNVPAVWFVFSETRFGRAALWRVGLSLLSLAAPWFIKRLKTLWGVQAALGTLVIATFPWTGHGAVHSGWPGAIHTAGDLLHLWAAGIWLGALLPLGILILNALRSRTSNDARAACHGLDRFSAIGSVVVVTLTASGLINGWFLVGPSNWGALFTTAYGVALLIKLVLFALMLAVAATNRLRFAPRLRYALDNNENRDTSAPLQALKTSVVMETALAALVLLAVGVLGTLPPPASGE